MKNLILILFIGISTNVFAQTNERVLLQESDGLKLAKLLLLNDTQQCLREQGFTGINSPLIDLNNILIKDIGDSTIYTLSVENYTILPNDGTRLTKTDHLTIQSKKVRTRAGTIHHVTCSIMTDKN